MERYILAAPAAARLIIVGQVEARSRVTAVHHGRELAALREVLDEYFKQLVVRNLPGALVIAGDDRLVIPVRLVARG